VFRYHLASRGLYGTWISASTLARVDPVAMGILLALLLDGRVPSLGKGLRWILIGGGILLLPETVLLYDATGLFSPAWAYMAGYAAATLLMLCLFLGFLGLRRGISESRAGQLFQYLGRISYGLYVWHGLALAGLGVVFNKLGLHKVLLLRAPLALLITIGIASASYYLLEAPFLKLKRRFSHVLSSGSEAHSTVEALVSK